EKRASLPGLNQSVRLLRTSTNGLADETAPQKPRDPPQLFESSASRLAPGGSLSLFARARAVAQDGMAAGSANAPSGARVELGQAQPGTQCCCSGWTGCCSCRLYRRSFSVVVYPPAVNDKMTESWPDRIINPNRAEPNRQSLSGARDLAFIGT